jgi:hypothetical protein
MRNIKCLPQYLERCNRMGFIFFRDNYRISPTEYILSGTFNSLNFAYKIGIQKENNLFANSSPRFGINP